MRAIFFFFVSVALAMPICSSQAQSAQDAASKRVQTMPAASSKTPELIYFDGIIYTGEGFADNRPQIVQAIAVGGGKVIAVGTTEKITRLAGPKTTLRDLNSANTGTVIFPGFNDAHTHLGGAGRTKLTIDLTGVKSLSAMLAMIEAAAKEAPAGHWLTGGNWDHTLWEPKILPTRQDLDKVTGDHPVFLDRIDGHIAIANTAALTAAGITGKTPTPQGGKIDLDASGAPTGILRESAKNLIYKIIPPPSHEDRQRRRARDQRRPRARRNQRAGLQ